MLTTPPHNGLVTRQVFAHDASVVMKPGGDERVPGAAITAELCGHWDHDGPCPVAPHHTTADRRGAELQLRILFATDPGAEADVRGRIDAALAQASLQGPDGTTTRWRLVRSRPSAVRANETDHAARLLGS